MAIQDSIESQKAVIALLLSRPELYPEFQGLRPEMFVTHPQPFAKIFGALVGLIKDKTTPTVTNVAADSGQSEAYIGKFTTLTPTDPPSLYATAIKETYNQWVQAEFAKGVSEATNPIQYVKESLAEFEDMLERRLPVSHIATIVDKYLERVELRLQSGVGDVILSTPWGSLNEKLSGVEAQTAGFYVGDYSVLAARPGMGKTSFLRQVRNHIMRQEGRGAVSFLLEMTKNKLLERMIAAEMGVPYSRVKDLSVLKDEILAVKFYNILSSIRGLPWYFYGSECNQIEDIEEIIFQHIAEDGICWVDIDHIGKLYSRRRSDNRTQEIAYISDKLRGFTTRDWLGDGIEKIHLMTVVQLNRNVEDRDDKRPRISDVKQSGGIEEDADVMLLMYRDDYYYPDSPEPGIAEIILGKNRNEETGVVKLRWQGDTMSFTELYDSGENLW